ncbi:MAG: PAS domain-containing protein [Deltaproteobacteria bacterium]|nr:PAS domain-containing protein [Deltaproteobacteria bacterium]
MRQDDQSKDDQSKDELIRFVEELKRRWLATIDALPDPLMFVDRDYKIGRVNKALAAFVSEPDLRSIIGKKCYEVFAAREQPCPGCLMRSSFEEGTLKTFSLNDVRGRYFFEVSSQPVFGEDGQTEGCVHVYRDRTEAKALQEQLFQSEKLASIGLLAGGIAHEINNPLGGILIFSQMLLKELPEDSPFLHDVREIESATQRCKSIVERLLNFARSQPSDISGNALVPVNVTEAAKTALRFARVHQNARKVEIIEEWHGSELLVMGERNKFIQLFLNLMQNAFHSMPDGGSLTLRSGKKKGKDGRSFGFWEVEDTGVGIAKEHLKRIFDPFFTTKEPGEGTGLGLSICYGICQDADGSLKVESRLNDGSVFRITLPLAQPASLT